MRRGTSNGRSGVWTEGSLFPLLVLIVAPLIVVILTLAFLGYAVWRLAFLLWQLLCQAWQAVHARRVPGTTT